MHKTIFTAIIVGLLFFSTTFDAAAQTTYTVEPGDNLSIIARQFGVSVSEIAAANNIVNPSLIFVGQVLTIPGGSDSGSGSSSGSTAAPTNTPAPAATQSTSTGSTGASSGSSTGETSTYRVASGDTLFGIAFKFQTTVAQIVALNDLSNANYIFVGQPLLIPGSGGGTVVAQPTTAPAAQPTTAPVAQPTTAPVVAAPTNTPAPPPPAAAGSGVNVLPNGSFEDGWYNLNGVPELQLPNGWAFEWDEGATGFGGNAWDVWVRPETRVLSRQFLPTAEHPLYITDGNHTVKIFKGSGAISARMYRDLDLQAGTYVMSFRGYPDLYTEYNTGKVWTTDPSAGEVRIIVNDGGSGWFFATPGQQNQFSHTFTLNSAQRVRVGAAIRGRYAILNNGWFIDNWTLEKVN